MSKINIYFKILVRFLILGIILVVFFSAKTIINPTLDRKIRVTTSFYPLYFFTKEIGDEKVVVMNLTPSGVEPHDYELTPSDILNINNSRLLVLNGKTLEPYLQKINAVIDPKKIKVIFTADKLTIDNDPHIWLDPVLAKKQSKVILEALVQIDPKNKNYYQKNFQKLEKKLSDLDRQYKQSLTNCKFSTIISSHQVFKYLASRYHFSSLSVSGLSPEEEPSLKKIAELAKVVKQENIHYLFMETLASPKTSKVLATELNLKLLIFNPLEGLTYKEVLNKADYFSVQKQNLANLRIARQCQ